MPEEFRRLQEQATEALYELTEAFGGSISAEHGIGVHKKSMHARMASTEQLALMHTLKQALDGHGLMNPGKVLAPI